MEIRQKAGNRSIRRRPEIRWNRLPSDPSAMAIRQSRILRHAAQHVAPSGVLVYSVCSPLSEEGRGVALSLAGWCVKESWKNLPPSHGEDVFQCFVLQREGEPTSKRSNGEAGAEIPG